MSCCICGGARLEKATLDTESPLCGDCYDLLGSPSLTVSTQVIEILLENRWRITPPPPPPTTPFRTVTQQPQYLSSLTGVRW